MFSRDFPYSVPAWGAAASLTIVAGVVTAATMTLPGQGYISPPAVVLTDANGTGAIVTAAVAGGKVGDLTVTAGGTDYGQPIVTFTGGAGDDTDLSKVRDVDIDGALQDAHYNVGECLFDTQTNWSRAYGYAAAHNLVQRLLASGEGIYSQFSWLTSQKSVGGVQQSFVIPDKIKDDPFLSMYSTTRYGMMYLQIIAPLLIGNMWSTHRETLP